MILFCVLAAQGLFAQAQTATPMTPDQVTQHQADFAAYLKAVATANSAYAAATAKLTGAPVLGDCATGKRTFQRIEIRGSNLVTVSGSEGCATMPTKKGNPLPHFPAAVPAAPAAASPAAPAATQSPAK
jgi:hypothetical protein